MLNNRTELSPRLPMVMLILCLLSIFLGVLLKQYSLYQNKRYQSKAEALYREAEELRITEKYQKAINRYKIILDKYPRYNDRLEVRHLTKSLIKALLFLFNSRLGFAKLKEFVIMTNGAFKMCGLNQNIYKIFESVGIANLLEIEASLEDAVKAIEEGR